MVTGASSGIGKACALRLDKGGFRVFATVLTEAEGAALQAEASPRLTSFVLELTSAASIASGVETVSRGLGGAELRGLVNNAGVLGCAPLELLSIEAVRQVFEINVIGQIALTQAFLPLLRGAKRQSENRRYHARIINMGSLAGRSALPFTSPYNASKFAFRALSDTWRVELRPQGIAVITVEPGMVTTPIWQKGSAWAGAMLDFPSETLALYPSFTAQASQIEQIAQKKGVSASEVALVVHRALTAPRPKSRYVVGREARLLLALERLPTPLRDWLVARRFSL